MAPSEDVLASQLEYLHTTRKHFDSVLDEAHYNEMRERKEKRLSFKARGQPPPPFACSPQSLRCYQPYFLRCLPLQAMQAALFITLYHVRRP
jgi:hypothetical protein